MPVFERLGSARAAWVPLAADPAMHRPYQLSEAERQTYGCDISFVGNWRPERERVLGELARLGVPIRIWGGERWKRAAATCPGLRGAWQGRPAFDSEFAKAVSGSKIGLNPIDDTNFPAANMRFFEVHCRPGGSS